MGKTITVTAEVDIEDVLDELGPDELSKAAIKKLGEPDASAFHSKMEAVYIHYRHRSDTPDCVRELVYIVLGRML